MDKTFDLHVVETRPILSPEALRQKFSLTTKAATLVAQTRERIRKILAGQDRRLLVIVGPCSIHDISAAIEYAQHLVQLRKQLQESLEIVMRVYFDKPRTTTGWKGLINDPHLDNSFDINVGLMKSRGLLLELAAMELPAATELLDPVIPQYLADLIAWTAIGARTTESQTHRQMASGLSMPVGFKNGTDGSYHSAINGMIAANHSHHFLGINFQGLASIVTTTGNPDTHLVLRGGQQGPNYSSEQVAEAAQLLVNKGRAPRLMIDCSHDNSRKDHQRQPLVLENIAQQLREGASRSPILGVMLESHLVAGKQTIPPDVSQLVYGQSITDACIDFETTREILINLASALSHHQLATC